MPLARARACMDVVVRRRILLVVAGGAIGVALQCELACVLDLERCVRILGNVRVAEDARQTEIAVDRLLIGLRVDIERQDLPGRESEFDARVGVTAQAIPVVPAWLVRARILRLLLGGLLLSGGRLRPGQDEGH